MPVLLLTETDPKRTAHPQNQTLNLRLLHAKIWRQQKTQSRGWLHAEGTSGL